MCVYHRQHLFQRKEFITHARYLVWSSISVFELDVGLLPDAVQVLMQAVKKEGQQFVGVLLLIA